MFRSAATKKRKIKRPAESMTEREVVSLMARKLDQGMNDDDSDLSKIRQENFNYLMGQPYGNERDGYSKFVTREVAETIEWIMPSIVRVLVSDDKIVEFEATTKDDVKAAELETDAVRHFIRKANNGQSFVAFHNWVKDALTNPVAYLKVWVRERVENEVRTFTGLDEEAVLIISEQDNAEIIEQSSYTETVTVDVPQAPAQPGIPPPPPQPQPVEVELFDLRVRYTYKVRELRLDPTPGEECIVDNDLTSLDLDEGSFVAHRSRKTYTELVLEGFDPDELDDVGTTESHDYDGERTNRLFYEDEDAEALDESDQSMRQFWVNECYADFDYDGDDLAESRRVVMVGSKVFANVEDNYQPMVAMSSILMPHKHNGMSVVDLVKDLQLLISTLTRQLLDNTYQINIRRKVFSEDSLTDDGATMDALLNAQAEYIPVRGPAQNAFVPEPTHSIVGELLPVIQHFRDERAMRSGVSPETSLDPNILRDSTAGAFMGALEQASQRIEMLVRIFLETGFRKVMVKIHQLLRSHVDMQTEIDLNEGGWTTINPKQWKRRNDLKINVGLGHNNHQQTMAILVQLISMQKEAAAYGLTNPEKVYAALKRLVKSSKIGHAEQFFVDPKSEEYKPPEPPPPDPNMIIAQAQAKALEAEQQRKMQEVQINAQLKAQAQQADAQAKQAQAQFKQAEQELRSREIAVRELEAQARIRKEAEEASAKVDNIEEDTLLKAAQTEKTLAEAEKLDQSPDGETDEPETE